MTVTPFSGFWGVTSSILLIEDAIIGVQIDTNLDRISAVGCPRCECQRDCGVVAVGVGSVKKAH